MINYGISQQSLKNIQKDLQTLGRTLAKKIIRSGLRTWGNETIQVMRSNMRWNDDEVKRAVKIKIVSFKRNRGIWIGVGIEGGKTTTAHGKPFWAATLGRWYNDGWTPYPKGRPTGDKKTKGWRKGVRNTGGRKIYQLDFLTKTATAQQRSISYHIEEAMRSALK